MADPSQVAKDLAALSKVARSRAYALLGGEPTLHPSIVEILRIAKSSKISDCIEVWTNGQTIEKMTAGFWFMLDKLVVSIYPGKSVDMEYIDAKCTEYGVKLEIKDYRLDRFSVPLSKQHATPEQAAVRYSRCWYKTYTHVVDDGYFYRCCTSPFIPELILDRPKTADGLPLAGITGKRLAEFLYQRETPLSCYRCGGHGSPKIEWREISERDAWMEASSI